MGAWCRRLATRGPCVGPNNAGVASIPEDVGELNRREAIESGFGRPRPDSGKRELETERESDASQVHRRPEQRRKSLDEDAHSGEDVDTWHR